MSRTPPPSRVLKAEHEAATHRVILAAARELFGRDGYSRVSVKNLAERAGVSIQTIYDNFGSKAGVVKRFADLVDEEAGFGELVPQIVQAEDPREALRLAARLRRRVRERCGDLIRILRSAAGDPDVAAAWAEGMSRRYAGQQMLTRRLEQAGRLRPGLTAQAAADIMAALSTEDLSNVLIDDRGWSFDEFETWLADTLIQLLLG